MPLAAPRTRLHVLVGLALGGVALATFLISREALSAFVAALVVLAYGDLRRLLARESGFLGGHVVTFVLGAAGVLGFLWSAYTGRLDLLPSAAAALVLSLLVSHIVLHEASASGAKPTSDIAATVAAATATGLLGAHVLLTRSVSRFGFRGLLAFGLMVIGNDVVSFSVGQWEEWRGRRKVGPARISRKSGAAITAGFLASVVIGSIVGLTLDPPFDVRSGIAFGAAMGVLAPLGDMVFSVIKRGAGASVSGVYLGPLGGALDAVDSLLFAAPAFYWAFRTLAL
jgi:CDP-diglyceride synthetase